MTREATEPGEAWALTQVIARLRRILRSSVRQELPWESLPMAQVELLQRLLEEPGLGVSELAERQRLATNTVSKLTQQMISAGLLQRRAHDTDRRAVILTVTSSGRDRLTLWQQANESRIRQALDGLAPHQRAAIQEALPALESLALNLEAQDAHPEAEGSGGAA